MKKVIGLVAVVLTLGVQLAQAESNVMLNIAGKLTTLTADQMVIETPHYTYFINRRSIPAELTSKLDKTEVDVSVYVPMDGIQKIKSHIKSIKK